MSMRMISQYNTMLFGEIFETLSDWNNFLTDYSSFVNVISSANRTLLYYLLMAKYGNDPIINKDLNQFYLKIAMNIKMHGPVWEKKDAVQTTIRGLSDDDLIIGAKQIYNEAYNPNEAPSTNTVDEIAYINSQKVSKNKRNKLDAYTLLYDALRKDATEEFIAKFKNCFSPFIVAPCPILYETTEEEENG